MLILNLHVIGNVICKDLQRGLFLTQYDIWLKRFSRDYMLYWGFVLITNPSTFNWFLVPHHDTCFFFLYLRQNYIFIYVISIEQSASISIDLGLISSNYRENNLKKNYNKMEISLIGRLSLKIRLVCVLISSTCVMSRFNYIKCKNGSKFNILRWVELVKSL